MLLRGTHQDAASENANRLCGLLRPSIDAVNRTRRIAVILNNQPCGSYWGDNNLRLCKSSR